MKVLHRFRFVIFGIAAAALIAATVLTMRSDSGGARVAGSLGPTPGPDSRGHIEAKRAYLRRIARDEPSRRAAALISFSRMINARAADGVIRGADISALFVKFPASDPEALKTTSTTSDAMKGRADELRSVVQAEIDGLQDEARTATGARRKEVEELLQERQRGLAAISADCACIYAVVAEGATLSELADAQKSPEVRLVDVPNPIVASLDGWRLTPILPSARTP